MCRGSAVSPLITRSTTFATQNSLSVMFEGHGDEQLGLSFAPAGDKQTNELTAHFLPR